MWRRKVYYYCVDLEAWNGGHACTALVFLGDALPIRMGKEFCTIVQSLIVVDNFGGSCMASLGHTNS